VLKYNHDDIEDDQIRRKNIYTIYYSVNVTFTVLTLHWRTGHFPAFSELNPDTLAGRGNAPTQHLSAGTNLANNKKSNPMYEPEILDNIKISTRTCKTWRYRRCKQAVQVVDPFDEDWG